MTATKRPLCPQCRDTAGWLEDEDGVIVGRCPCRLEPSPEAARDQALTAVAGAHPGEFNAALRIIRETALANPIFSSNDTRPRMRLAEIDNRNTIGAAYRQAIKDRVIRRISYVRSTDPGTKQHPVAEYESLIYRATGRAS